MSWLDDVDDDEPEFDEADVRVRPNPKANRPRTKRRPAHADARIARVLGVDRGRYTVLIDEDGQSRFVRRGERIGDWTLDSLQDRAAGFVRGAERRSIELSVAPADATPAPAGPRSNRGAAQPTVPAPTASPAAVSRPRPASPAPALAAPAATPAPAADGPPAKRGSFGGSAPSRPPAPDSAAR